MPAGCPDSRIVRSKNGVSLSTYLLNAQQLPHQYWVLELRASLTKVGNGAKYAQPP